MITLGGYFLSVDPLPFTDHTEGVLASEGCGRIHVYFSNRCFKQFKMFHSLVNLCSVL